MLLDTNAISALSKPDVDLVRVLPADRSWYFPTIALGEFRFGLKKSVLQRKLEAWLDTMEMACEILAPDETTARHYANIRHALNTAGVTIPYHDIWIAALALQHNLPIVTRDAHFDRVSGIRRIGW